MEYPLLGVSTGAADRQQGRAPPRCGEVGLEYLGRGWGTRERDGVPEKGVKKMAASSAPFNLQFECLERVLE